MKDLRFKNLSFRTVSWHRLLNLFFNFFVEDGCSFDIDLLQLEAFIYLINVLDLNMATNYYQVLALETYIRLPVWKTYCLVLLFLLVAVSTIF